jgi:hypothetical protein
MEKKAEKNHIDQWLKDLPIQAENLAFKSEEMIFCKKCERKNPPTRFDCLYCGAELELSEERSEFLKPNLRKLENWEKGFNLIYSPDSQNFDKAKLPEFAKMLKCNEEFLEKLIGAEKPLPLARVESKKEAEIIQNSLTKFGFQTLIIDDEDLAIEKHARRLRGVKFLDDKIIFILFNQDEIVEIAKKDLALIVSGAIFERKIEATERRVKKAENKILQTGETASDEFLIDIYTRQDATGYRIFAKGFDFSCLETEKGILAIENLKKLAQKLREVATEAKFVDDYLKMREILGNVWQVEERTDSQGLKREGFGKFYLENLTTINNLSQFTKYSRLQHRLL